MHCTKVKKLSDQLEVAFGTSGVRGLVSSLIPELCFAFAAGFLKSVCSNAKHVAIGIDLRPSSPEIARACISAAESLGISVVYCGALPTPALAFYAMQQGMPAIMVTGSHIPFDRNGIKFYRPDGEISKQDEASIMAADVSIPNSLSDTLPCLPEVNMAGLAAFYARYDSLFPKGMLEGKRIGVYEHSSVARDVIKTLLVHYGADVISLDRTETFVPIDTEAVSEEDVAKGLSWSAKYQLDAIVSTDGDGDRPLIANEKGEWLRGDVLGVLCANYLNATDVAAPINVNTLLELEGKKRTPFRRSLRTKIGSPFVIEGMEKLAENDSRVKVVGYEANGGFLVGSDIVLQTQTLRTLPTRDSILPMFIVFALAYDADVPISRLLDDFVERYTASDRLKNISANQSIQWIEAVKQDEAKQAVLVSAMARDGEVLSVTSINEMDGLRMTLSNQDILHLRPSGNAPELRCYIEGSDLEILPRQLKNVLDCIATQIDQ